MVDEAVPWTRNGRPRIAGISGFGFSGTNAHVIVEEAPAEPAVATGPVEVLDDGRFTVLPLSARTPAALVEVAHRYRNWLTAHPDVDVSDVCLSAGAGRSHFEQRAGLVVNSTASANELLGALVDDRPAQGLMRGECGDPPKTAWLFPGQGSQYVGMGRELFDSEPVFAETVNRCAAAVKGILEKPLLEVIFGDHGDDALRHTSYAQPALFAVELGLARLWQSWGLEPDVVLGHSVGQYSAACVTGVFGLEDGAALLAERGRLFGSLPAGGRMVAAFTEADRIESYTDEFPRLAVAAYNGGNTVLSGPAEDLEQAVAGLTADGVRCEWLDTSHAFHSALLDPVLDEFESYASGFEFGSPQRTLVCNRTGVAVGRQASMDAAYWRRHARQPVEFAKSVRSLAELGCTLLLEVGPQPVLTAAALRAWPDTERRPEAIASLRRSGSDQRQISDAFAKAYVAGHRPDFAAAAPARGRKVDLPTYPFQHRKFWYATPPTSSAGDAARTDTVRLLEEGRIDELAALVGATSGDDQTVRALKQVAAQHNQQRSSQTIADARYEISWEKSATAASALEPVDEMIWLLIADDTEVVAPLADLLTGLGHRHRNLAMPGSDADEVELEAALRTAAAEHPALRIVHLGGLDPDGATSARSLDRMQHRVLAGTQRIFRSALAAEIEAPIWLVTRGAQRVTRADTVSPVQSVLWGFGRTASFEHPQLWGGLADMAAGGADDWSGLVAHILAAPVGEDQVALRDGAAYFARLSRRSAPPAAAPLELRGDASYLVTGGLGAVGLEMAEYLAARGARQLVLTARRPPSEAAQLRIEAIREQHDCEVVVLAADVSDPDDVARVLTTIRTELPPLVGIVHAAGALGSTSLLDMDDAEVDRVFAGKVWGAWYLSEAAASLQLDFFVCTSSIAAMWGTRTQIVYSAANAFLDGLAWRLRERGVPGVSVEFGLWSTGMGDGETRKQLDVLGIRTLSSADALAGMAELITSSAPHGMVARFDWSRFVRFQQLQRRRSLLTNIERELPETAVIPTSSTATQLTSKLQAAPVQQRKQLMLEYLRNAVADVTHIDAQEIRDDAGLFDIGMDSLMAVELHSRLERGLGRQLPVTIAMDHPRLTDAAGYLVTDVLGVGVGDRAPARSDPVVTLTANEPIAIVGLACRFPGARDADEFWQLLADGVDMIREIPDDRYDVDDFYDPDPDAAGKIYSRYGGFLDGIDGFDPEFFGISPREAVWIDPQQRLVLETAWEGLERAGYAPSALRGSRSGVYVGVGANEYSYVLSGSSLEDIEAQFATGNATSVIAGRVAFALGLEGPAVSLDTACSSSLVAIHTACQALHSGDCDLALAGGVNVLLSPAITIATSRARMLSPDGRCKTFDAAPTATYAVRAAACWCSSGSVTRCATGTGSRPSSGAVRSIRTAPQVV